MAQPGVPSHQQCSIVEATEMESGLSLSGNSSHQECTLMLAPQAELWMTEHVGEDWREQTELGTSDPAKFPSKSLENRGIDAQGAKAIASVLPQTQFTAMWLGRNNLGDEGAAAIADGLRGKNKITHIQLDRNNIGDDGAKAIAAALPEARHLSRLWLDGNNIGRDGAVALAEFLPMPDCGVCKLWLNGNNVGNAGAASIADCLPRTRIHWLEVKDNDLDDATQVSLKAVWKRKGNRDHKLLL
jgi:hypothetical protein